VIIVRDEGKHIEIIVYFNNSRAPSTPFVKGAEIRKIFIRKK